MRGFADSPCAILPSEATPGIPNWVGGISRGIVAVLINGEQGTTRISEDHSYDAPSASILIPHDAAMCRTVALSSARASDHTKVCHGPLVAFVVHAARTIAAICRRKSAAPPLAGWRT